MLHISILLGLMCGD